MVYECRQTGSGRFGSWHSNWRVPGDQRIAAGPAGGCGTDPVRPRGSIRRARGAGAGTWLEWPGVFELSSWCETCPVLFTRLDGANFTLSADVMAASVPADLDGLADLTAGISCTRSPQPGSGCSPATNSPSRRPGGPSFARCMTRPATSSARSPALLAAAGPANPPHHARILVAWAEGIMFDTIAGGRLEAHPDSRRTAHQPVRTPRRHPSAADRGSR